MTLPFLHISISKPSLLDHLALPKDPRELTGSVAKQGRKIEPMIRFAQKEYIQEGVRNQPYKISAFIGTCRSAKQLCFYQDRHRAHACGRSSDFSRTGSR